MPFLALYNFHKKHSSYLLKIETCVHRERLLRIDSRYDILRTQTGKEAYFIGNTRQYTMASRLLLRRGTGTAGL